MVVKGCAKAWILVVVAEIVSYSLQRQRIGMGALIFHGAFMALLVFFRINPIKPGFCPQFYYGDETDPSFKFVSVLIIANALYHPAWGQINLLPEIVWFYLIWKIVKYSRLSSDHLLFVCAFVLIFPGIAQRLWNFGTILLQDPALAVRGIKPLELAVVCGVAGYCWIRWRSKRIGKTIELSLNRPA
jgi:hypothetical protein